ncbi:carbohydrate-responsive element-binding protein-like [Hemiscyllium ocellatum]|uniref:carbohydrate-responsive element-binding protein-like n=1 Tax=Hemiscyllium ocellatum TaxID=170820 RepID=UPI00296779E8|nr:carbohydrate-responsive element-binding protein-like [Hemiscyllium ocellatum]
MKLDDTAIGEESQVSFQLGVFTTYKENDSSFVSLTLSLNSPALEVFWYTTSAKDPYILLKCGDQDWMQYCSSGATGHKCGSGKLSLTDPGEQESVTQSPRSTANRKKLQTNKSVTRRTIHISAEQKRRFNIKLGFDTLHSLVTSLDSQPAVKVSKATTLQKTAAYITKLQQEQAQTQKEAQRIREDIEKINAAINIYQQQLPATGVPVTQQRFRQMREMFNEYVRVRTLCNWKFWIFSFIIRPLFESFNGMVSTSSLDDLYQSALAWLEQHCSLPTLRLSVLNSLRQLSTSTSILTDPSLVPEQAIVAMRNPSRS